VAAPFIRLVSWALLAYSHDSTMSGYIHKLKHATTMTSTCHRSECVVSGHWPDAEAVRLLECDPCLPGVMSRRTRRTFAWSRAARGGCPGPRRVPALVAVAAETGEMSTAVETRMVRATEAAALALLPGFFMFQGASISLLL